MAIKLLQSSAACNPNPNKGVFDDGDLLASNKQCCIEQNEALNAQSISNVDQQQSQLTTTTSVISTSNTKSNSNIAVASKLKEFYNNKTLLITGASGFIGKVFLVKLLLSLQNVGKVFVLMRSKKGLSSSVRFSQMLNKEPFTSVWKLLKLSDEQKSKLLNKFVVIEGDMQELNLGLSATDMKSVLSEVQVLFNIAASVQFDAPVKANLRDNYYGAKNLLNLCVSMKELISFVHVSTFYTNCHMSHIDENIHELKCNIEKLAQIIDWLPEKALNECEILEHALLEQRPNTYILTKAMSENLVASFARELPIAIVRPSIVVPSVSEPFAGWVDSINGPMGLGALASIGLLRFIDWDYYAHADVVPVDSCVNLMLAVGERTVRLRNNYYHCNSVLNAKSTSSSSSSPEKISNNTNNNNELLKVYNLTTGTESPQTWGLVFEELRAATFEAPPMKMLRIPIKVPKIKRANKLTLQVSHLSELLFAYFVDFLLVCFGQKKVLTRITQKLHKAFKILLPFMTTSFTSDTTNFRQAYNELQPDDKREFCFDLQQIDWRQYYRNAYMGGRKQILREDPSNIAAAKTKMRVLYAVETIFELFVGYALASYVYKWLSMMF